jgi:hypothetical protein
MERGIKRGGSGGGREMEEMEGMEGDGRMDGWVEGWRMETREEKVVIDRGIEWPIEGAT